MQISATSNIDEVLQTIEGIQQKGTHLAHLMSDIANHLFNVADEAFDNEASPDGRAWQPLAASTVAAKGHNRRLHDTGDMRQTLDYSSDSKSATVGTNAVSNDSYPYPAVHQFGTDNDHVPARPFMPFDDDGDLLDDTADNILNLVLEHFAN